jgi:hypothetical protein
VEGPEMLSRSLRKIQNFEGHFCHDKHKNKTHELLTDDEFANFYVNIYVG